MSILEYIIVSFFWILFFFFTNIPNEQKKVGFSQQGNKQEVNYSTCKTKTNKKSWVVLQVENNSPPSCRCCCDSITGCVLNSTTAFKNTNRKGHRTIHNQHQCLASWSKCYIWIIITVCDSFIKINQDGTKQLSAQKASEMIFEEGEAEDDEEEEI